MALSPQPNTAEPICWHGLGGMRMGTARHFHVSDAAATVWPMPVSQLVQMENVLHSAMYYGMSTTHLSA